MVCWLDHPERNSTCRSAVSRIKGFYHTAALVHIEKGWFMLALCLGLLVHAQPVVVSLSQPSDTTPKPSPIQVVEVRDLRRMATLDVQGVGVTTLGVFEERAPLRTEKPVAQEVEALCRKWLRPTGDAIKVRLELLSLESWSVPVDGPDPFHAIARVRVVSVDSSRPGVLLVPEAKSERNGLTTASDQAVMLSSALRDALAMVRPEMKPVAGAATPSAPEFDAWADPRKGAARDTLPMRLKQSVSLLVTPGVNTVAMGLRYAQNMEPQHGWIHGYWGGLMVRGPWTDDDYDQVWSGETQGGMSWWKRLDDGRSNWATANSVGAVAGTERFKRVHTDSVGGRHMGAKDSWWYLGGEVRSGFRWAERTESGMLFECGAFGSVRVPSSIGWFDAGLYASAGWRF